MNLDDPFDPPEDPAERAAYLRERAAQARARAQALFKTVTRETWQSDPGLLIQVKTILAMPPEQRLRMLMAEHAVFASARPAAE
ncbi:hypothetical protein I6A84_03940 [Frankia sp. CNm7]|uniref:Uncharacterized protein n=1 Tax=Frankia nepalensis TaxID=1836974 RepID=A0A937UQR5_9ACTN|nr:hypothetical protein [Frankia nepalensis]MBL7500884.1 hypothetical protein [Frankia nepalensis]MBL7509250.1 hypothetical protein [Frankia nepalensis]MBL7517291.1 hypothetical protein [Frankia nepalensis]MBL7626986.1 hypothetical protein [Frankia nepalensis]